MKQIEEQIKRNAAGQDSKERLGGPVLEQIPFLQNCEDEDSGEDDELDSVQRKRPRVKLPSRPWFLRWRTKMRRSTQRTPSTSLISWALERMGRALRPRGHVLERGPTMNWKAGGSNSRGSWLTFRMWMGCPPK